MRIAVRRLLGAVLVVHGLLHLIGLDRDGWVLWIAAAAAMVTSGVLLALGRRRWWTVGVPAAVLSQMAVVTEWHDARWATLANLVLAAAAVHGGAADSRQGLRAQYDHLAATMIPDAVDADRLVTEADLVHLPGPVAAYVRATGAVGLPHVYGFRATISGRIRSSVGSSWMRFSGEQVDAFATPGPSGAASGGATRVFRLDATTHGVPVDVLHTYLGSRASMHARAMSMMPVADLSGPEMLRAETVTVLNDLCVLAPAALVDTEIDWRTVDEHHVEATYTNAGCTVRALLVFDDAHHLVDFVSDDRLRASADGRQLEPERWSTPITEYRTHGARRIATIGTGRWHPPAPGEPFDYLEFHLDSIEMLHGRPAAPGAVTAA